MFSGKNKLLILVTLTILSSTLGCSNGVILKHSKQNKSLNAKSDSQSVQKQNDKPVDSKYKSKEKANSKSDVKYLQSNSKVVSLLKHDENREGDSNRHIKDLQFHRSLNGGAVFDVFFEEKVDDFFGYKTKLSQDGYTLTITFEGVSISDKWVSDINTEVFNTIVNSIEVSKQGSNVVFTLHSFDRISLNDSNKSDRIEFSIIRHDSRVKEFDVNKPISVSFEDKPIKAVLKILSDLAGFNLVVGNSVKGNISLDLKNVPWNEVMNVVLVSKGLATKKMSGILYVATATEIAAQERLELQARKSLQSNVPLVTKFIRLNYTTAREAQMVIISMANNKGSGVMSSRGSISVDRRTNMLIVTDIQEKINRIREIIDKIDIPNDQLLVGVRIVEVKRSNSSRLGFNYQLSDPLDEKTGLNFNTLTSESTSKSVGITAKLAYTILGGMRLNMEIQALEEESLANQIASPHLVVTNNQIASIKQGSDIPYNQTSANGVGSIAFQEAVLEVRVTPQIAPDGNILMRVLITKNSVGASKRADTPPPIEKREISTKIMTKDGQTIVIGGIYEKQKNETINKIPILGDIPILGRLFRYKEVSNEDKELLVFITPKIIESKTKQ